MTRSIYLASCCPDGIRGKTLSCFGLLLILVAGCYFHVNNPKDDFEFLIDAEGSNAERISEVLTELERGYGGTLVSSPHDPAIDSPAFVERYLTRFAKAKKLKDYDYLFERLLSRVYEHPDSIRDKRLDHPTWNAYQQLEADHPGRYGYQIWNTVYTLDSARDFLWMYLEINAQEILQDKERRSFWIDKLLDPTEKSDHLFRIFAALRLVASVQNQLQELDVLDFDRTENIPGGLDGLKWFAHKKGLELTVWGFDPNDLPPPKVISITTGRWECEDGISQESWSKIGCDFSADRGDSMSAYLVPRQLEDDGIFFFSAEGRLHVWLKKDFFSGVVQMLRISGFVNKHQQSYYLEKLGVNQLNITYESKSSQPQQGFRISD